MLTKELISRIFTHIPTLQTKRLILRQICPRDAEDMFDYASREEVTRYLLWSPHETKSYTAHYVNYLQKRYKLGDFHDWAVIFRENNKMIGTCGFTSFQPSANTGEVGYVLHPDYWGKEIASEALSAVIDFGFHRMQLHRIEARYMVENVASRRVMEHCGMTFEGVLREAVLCRGKYEDVGVCSILADEFFENEKKLTEE